jgi:hypothetical protein
MCIRVVVVYYNRIVAGYDGPTFYAGSHGFSAGHTGFFLDSADEFGADDAFMDKFIAGLKLALGIPLGHPGTGAGTTGRPVDGFVAIKNSVAGRGTGV